MFTRTLTSPATPATAILKHALATVAVAAGVLAAAGSASAGTHQAGVITYNGHAGLGASAYQHNQSDLEFLTFSPLGPGSDGVRLGSTDALVAGVTDGTSNTIMFGARAAAPAATSDHGSPTATRSVALTETPRPGSLGG